MNGLIGIRKSLWCAVRTLCCFAVKSSLLAVTLLWASFSSAHETKPSVADIEVQGDHATVEIFLTAEALLAGIDLSKYKDTNDAPQAETYNTLRAMSDDALAAELQNAWPSLASKFLVEGGGPLEFVSATPEAEPDLELPRDTRLILKSQVTAGADAFRFGWVKENGPLVARWGDAEMGFAALLNNGDLSPAIQLDGTAGETGLQNFWRFVVEGVEHIIPKGLDHILFVLGLFFFALAWRPLLSQVTAFTLAHTVTLGLATVGVINIADSQMWIVESLIALSITYVAVENILRPQLGWWRIVVVFGFGLLHGLGFASVLSDVGLAPGRFIASLVAFNIGVELGQLAVILAGFVLIVAAVCFARLSRLPAEQAASEAMPVMHRSVSIVGSILIGLVGVYWVIERAIL